MLGEYRVQQHQQESESQTIPQSDLPTANGPKRPNPVAALFGHMGDHAGRAN
jgi:hypothetical protein